MSVARNRPHHRPGRRRHWCAASGCRTQINRQWLMCGTCWHLVPEHLRRAITDYYQPTRSHQTTRYWAAVRQSIDAITDQRRGAA